MLGCSGPVPSRAQQLVRGALQRTPRVALIIAEMLDTIPGRPVERMRRFATPMEGADVFVATSPKYAAMVQFLPAAKRVGLFNQTLVLDGWNSTRGGGFTKALTEVFPVAAINQLVRFVDAFRLIVTEEIKQGWRYDVVMKMRIEVVHSDLCTKGLGLGCMAPGAWVASAAASALITPDLVDRLCNDQTLKNDTCRAICAGLYATAAGRTHQVASSSSGGDAGSEHRARRVRALWHQHDRAWYGRRDDMEDLARGISRYLSEEAGLDWSYSRHADCHSFSARKTIYASSLRAGTGDRPGGRTIAQERLAKSRFCIFQVEVKPNAVAAKAALNRSELSIEQWRGELWRHTLSEHTLAHVSRRLGFLDGGLGALKGSELRRMVFDYSPLEIEKGKGRENPTYAHGCSPYPKVSDAKGYRWSRNWTWSSQTLTVTRRDDGAVRRRGRPRSVRLRLGPSG